METQKPQTAKAILRKKKGAGGINLSNFRVYYKATKTHIVLAQKQKYRPMEQDRRHRNKPTHLWALIFDKGGKNTEWGKDSLFSKWCWENWTATCKTMILEHFLTPSTKINSKWIKDLIVRPETMKLLEENIGRTLDDINQARSSMTHFLQWWK